MGETAAFFSLHELYFLHCDMFRHGSVTPRRGIGTRLIRQKNLTYSMNVIPRQLQQQAVQQASPSSTTYYLFSAMSAAQFMPKLLVRPSLPI